MQTAHAGPLKHLKNLPPQPVGHFVDNLVCKFRSPRRYWLRLQCLRIDHLGNFGSYRTVLTPLIYVLR
jgi:hypothetical protein